MSLPHHHASHDDPPHAACRRYTPHGDPDSDDDSASWSGEDSGTPRTGSGAAGSGELDADEAAGVRVSELDLLPGGSSSR